MLNSNLRYLLKNFLILSTCLQLSCSGLNPRRQSNYEPENYFSYPTYYNFSQIKTRQIGNDLEVNLQIEKIKTGLKKEMYIGRNLTDVVRWNSQDLISRENSPIGTKLTITPGKISYKLGKENSPITLETDSAGKINFLIQNLNEAYYKFTELVSCTKGVYVDNQPPGTNEFIMTIELKLEGEPFFELLPRFYNIDAYSKSRSDWEFNKKQDLLKFNKEKNKFLENYSKFNLFGVKTPLLQERKKREDAFAEQEKRRIENQERESERRRIEEERQEALERERLDKIIQSTIRDNLEQLTIHVQDEDNGLPIAGAGISITSDASPPKKLLIQKGFPKHKLDDFYILDYPNSWNANNWGDGQFCSSSTDHDCSFTVYKKAKHRFIIKHREYYAVDAVVKPIKDGYEYIVEMSKIGTKIKLDVNLFGGRGKIRKK